MSNKTGPVAAINSDETEVRERMARGEARRKAFAAYMGEDGDLLSSSLSHEQAKLAEHFLWRAFIAGEKHGRAQLDARRSCDLIVIINYSCGRGYVDRHNACDVIRAIDDVRGKLAVVE